MYRRSQQNTTFPFFALPPKVYQDETPLAIQMDRHRRVPMIGDTSRAADAAFPGSLLSSASVGPIPHRQSSDLTSSLSQYLLKKHQECVFPHPQRATNSLTASFKCEVFDAPLPERQRVVARKEIPWWQKRTRNSLSDLNGVFVERRGSLPEADSLSNASSGGQPVSTEGQSRRAMHVKKVRLYNRDEVQELKPSREPSLLIDTATSKLPTFPYMKKSRLEPLPQLRKNKTQVGLTSDSAEVVSESKKDSTKMRRSSLPPEAFVQRRRSSLSKSFVREKTQATVPRKVATRRRYSLQPLQPRSQPTEEETPEENSTSEDDIEEDKRMTSPPVEPLAIHVSDTDSDTTLDGHSPMTTSRDEHSGLLLSPIREGFSRAASSRHGGRTTRLGAKTPNPFKGAMFKGYILTEAMKQQFYDLDTDEDGHIHFSQLRSVLQTKELSHAERKYLKMMYDLTSATTFFGVEEFALIMELTEKIMHSNHIVRSAFKRMTDIDLHETTYTFLEQFQEVATTHLDRSQAVSVPVLKRILLDILKLQEEDLEEMWEQIAEDLDLEFAAAIAKLDYLTMIPYFVSLQPSLHTQFVAQRAKTLLQV